MEPDGILGCFPQLTNMGNYTKLWRIWTKTWTMFWEERTVPYNPFRNPWTDSLVAWVDATLLHELLTENYARPNGKNPFQKNIHTYINCI